MIELAIKRASADERVLGWSWDYKMLETLHDETRSVDGYENSMEAINAIHALLATLPFNAELNGGVSRPT